MRIIKGNDLYVQKSDLAFALRGKVFVPKQLLKKLRLLYDSIYVVIVKMGDFVGVSDACLAAYLIDVEWLVDFDEVKNLSIREIRKLEKEYLGDYCACLDRVIDESDSRVTCEEAYIAEHKYTQIMNFRKANKWRFLEGWVLTWELPR